MEISSIHPIIISDDTEKIMKFYGSLGFTTKHTAITDMGGPTYVIASGDVEIEIMESPKNPHFPMPTGLFGLRLNVDDLEGAVETIKQNGGTILAGPLETSYANIYSVKDAGGNYLTIMKHIKK